MSEPTIDPKDARQGEASGRVRTVLGVSLAGAAIALGAVLIFFA